MTGRVFLAIGFGACVLASIAVWRRCDDTITNLQALTTTEMPTPLLAGAIDTELGFRNAAIVAIGIALVALGWFAITTSRLHAEALAAKSEVAVLHETRESRQLQAQKMESIGQLAAGIAHEINTPTQYIGDNIRFLRMAYDRREAAWKCYRELFEKVKNGTATAEDVNQVEEWERSNRWDELRKEIPIAIDECLDGITRVSAIVWAMKDYAHPGVDSKVDVNLNPTIESAVTVARNEWKNVAEVELDLLPSLPTVWCNPGEVGQLVLNLVINAAHAIRDASREKGQITVRSYASGERAVIEVSDNGVGIPPEIRARIFEEFFTTKQSGEGTGLGLSIVKRVVETHSGSIEVDSTVGVGTTFRIRLPIAKPQVAEPSEAA